MEYPNETFHWWKMARTPTDPWQDKDRFKEYIAWLAEKLNFKEKKERFKVAAKDFQDNMVVQYKNIIHLSKMF